LTAEFAPPILLPVLAQNFIGGFKRLAGLADLRFRLGNCVWCLFLLFFVKIAWAEEQPYAGLSPEEAAEKMQLPPDFKATLFAGEPDVKQPIAMAIDDRGRLWVAENYTYPVRSRGDIGKDRILVFEDTHGDGKFDKRTVFMEGLNLVSGLEVGFGGVWVGAAPYLIFIPIRDGDEPAPAGKPEILLDGFGYEDTHHVLNTFTWGPDGWLYGCEGDLVNSNVGKPGAPDATRVKINGGIWRYHPTRRTFELFAEGSSNPWGIDFDEHGQCITGACVIPHLFHMIQGGRFMRMAGSHFNPYVYDDIKTIADHLHWGGDLEKGPFWTDVGRRPDATGGGHAHSGLLIYQGLNWPEEYRGKYFMNNIHGQCINMDIPERKGSGFVAHHGRDFIEFNDPWSLVLNLETGPDGSVYMIDWYDQNQCHTTNAAEVDRSNGRIFNISYGNTKSARVDLPRQSTLGLVDLLDSNNNWYARHAQRLLQERCSGTHEAPRLRAIFMDKILDPAADPLTRLRHVWALGVVDGSAMAQDATTLLQRVSTESADEYIRAWLIQFLCEVPHPSPEMLDLFARLAREDKSPVVRLYLASALQRLPVEDRWEVLAGLYSHAEDAADHNLPLMVWYAAEPLPALDCERALSMAESARLPKILDFSVRRTVALGTARAFAVIFESLLSINDDQRLLEILHGLSGGLRGQRHLPMPAGWDEVESKLRASHNTEIYDRVQSISLIFGSRKAMEALRQTLIDKSADEKARRAALFSLLAVKASGLAPTLQGLLNDAGLRGDVLRSLAAYDDPQTPQKILDGYISFSPDEKRNALHTLTARVNFARPLMSAIGAEVVPRSDITGDMVQQLRNMNDPQLNLLTAQTWGALRESSSDKKAMIEKYKLVCSPDLLKRAFPSKGRAVFARLCQQCHTMFDTGGKVGPDLTGSNRRDLNFLLESIIDPSAIIALDYRAWTLETDDGRTITGILKEQDEKTVLIATPNETLLIPRKEIKSLQQNALSLMPEGLLDNLSDDDVRNLVRYLARIRQVPLPVANPN
jgi:putative membrane-bound dehydrogenase-like protein